jgi:hypothetical protein
MAAIDTCAGSNLNYPHSSAAVVTPDDANDLAAVTRAVYIGGTGHLNVIMMDGQTVLFSALPVGTVLPIRAKRIKSTSTTATPIVAMW